MKNLKGLFSLKSIGLVFVMAFAVILSNYAEASTSETITTATMGIGAMRPDVFERGSNFMNWLIGENKAGRRKDFDAQFIADYEAGQKTIEAFSYYIRKKIGTDGKVKLIESTDKNMEGITNMGEGRLGKGTYLALTDIFVAYASSATDVQPDTLIYTNSIYDSTTQYVNGAVDTDAGAAGNQFMPVAAQAVPAKLVNGELTIKAGNSPIVSQFLLSDLFINNRTGVAMPGNGAVALRVPKLINGELDVTAELQYPKGGAIAAAFNYFHLQLIGVRVANK